MRPQQETKLDEDVKKRIMDEARSLFFRYGFSKVTMDEAAEGLGMSKKTLYRYFPSKEVLLEEITAAHIDECDARMRTICARAGSMPLERRKLTMSYLAAIYGPMGE